MSDDRIVAQDRMSTLTKVVNAEKEQRATNRGDEKQPATIQQTTAKESRTWRRLGQRTLHNAD